LEKIASLADTRQVVYCLDASRLTTLAESPLGRLLPLGKHRRPETVATIAKPPMFGRQLYELIGKSKIVLNGAIDMAGHDRGNMRCFEAMGCGALLLSDAGNYPEAMNAGETMIAYSTAGDCLDRIQELLIDWDDAKKIADNGRARIRDLYSKEFQWTLFRRVIASL
jgi:hypothetical protein